MTEREIRLAKLENELYEKQINLLEFKLLVYDVKFGFYPTEKQIAQANLWQEDIDLIKEEINLVKFGCSLAFRGFSWVDIFKARKREFERNIRLAVERGEDPRPMRINGQYPSDIVDELVNTPSALGKEVKDVYGNVIVGGPEFLTTYGS